jgi:hypothetical protein
MTNSSGMRPARFVTLCFLYSGVILLAQYAVIYQFQRDLGALAQLGVGISILVTGLARVWYPKEEHQNPAEWGLFTYGMAALSLFLTVIFLAQLLVL